MERVAFTGFAWDEGNLTKCVSHGMTVPDIEHVLTHAETMMLPDVRFSTSESRFIAIGKAPNGRFAFVVFTPRKTLRTTLLRPISARYMHQREIRKYEQIQKDAGLQKR